VRIAIAGFIHESNTFSEVPTTVQHFKDSSLEYGADLIPVWEEAHHEVGGFIQGAGDNDFEGVPILMGWATPSGPLTSEAYEQIVADLISGLTDATDLDGLLLALHGAMVCESHPDADGETMRRVREALGPDFPIFLTLDLHTNISPRMIDNATATITYRTYPHIKQRFRGLEAAELIARTVRGEVNPVQALRKPPLLLHIVQQYSGAGAMAEIMAEVERVSDSPGILTASFAPGYIYADVEEMGPAVVVVADGDQELAESTAQALADFVWDRREDLNAKLPPPAAAVKEAAEHREGPVSLMDCGDNIGGGSPGDSTILLAEILKQDVPDCLVILNDPKAVNSCVEAGVRANVTLEVGGKTDRNHGDPVTISGRVRMIADGEYIEPEPRHGGKRFGNMGVTAVVETGEGHLIILTSLREAPMSLQQVLCLGIRPESRRIMVVKGATAPLAAYAPVSAKIIPVDTPGVSAAGPENFTYHNRPKPLFPLDPIE
jgi:microcystin degradation protein MlrC